VIAGNFYDSNFNNYGFLRATDGKITVFDFPAVLTSGFFVPFFSGISAGGVIVGDYIDANFATHGFLRAADGAIITFDVPNAVQTSSNSINDSGTVTGTYIDQNGNLRFFLRKSDGTFTTFAAPQTGFGGGAAINSSGAVAGNVQNNVCDPVTQICTATAISFLRGPNGTTSAVSDPAAMQLTTAVAINPAGVVTGNYVDANGVTHGFVVRKP
jgi:hypothetical protein